MNGHVELGLLIDLQPVDRSEPDDDRTAGASSGARELTERIDLIEFLWHGPGGVQPVLLAVRHLLE